VKERRFAFVGFAYSVSLWQLANSFSSPPPLDGGSRGGATSARRFDACSFFFWLPPPQHTQIHTHAWHADARALALAHGRRERLPDAATAAKTPLSPSSFLTTRHASQMRAAEEQQPCLLPPTRHTHTHSRTGSRLYFVSNPARSPSSFIRCCEPLGAPASPTRAAAKKKSGNRPQRTPHNCTAPAPLNLS